MELLLGLLIAIVASGALLKLVKKLLDKSAEAALKSENKIDDLILPLRPFLDGLADKGQVELMKALEKKLEEMKAKDEESKKK
jgi:hypothetical protein